MVKLNEDVLLLILKELQNDNNSLHSCLLVNKTWCKITIPILWKDPNPCKKLEKKQFIVIISHLSNEIKENLESQGIKLSVLQQKPLFNYISFIRQLRLDQIEEMVIFIEKNTIYSTKHIEKSNLSIIRTEILRLFINRNTKFTHLYIPSEFNYQIHLFPGVEHCFSVLEFLFCALVDTHQNLLEGLARTSKSIKKLMIDFIRPGNNYSGVVKLIETQKNLNNAYFLYMSDKQSSYRKPLEESLIKHADTIQHLQIDGPPITKILSYLKNLTNLEIDSCYENSNYSYLENVTLPDLKILKAPNIPLKILTNLIENTKGHLTELSIGYINDERKIKAIYQNCPNLKYFNLPLDSNDFSGLEELLIHCQHLEGLVIKAYYLGFDWDNLFKILIKSSPISLFKFKFMIHYILSVPKLESLLLFLDNWKGRRPMLLKTSTQLKINSEIIEKYKAEGIVENYENNAYTSWLGDEKFEWIYNNNNM